MFIKGVESDASDFMRNLHVPASPDSVGNLKDRIDPETLEKNKQLKLDCYNNLSGNHKEIGLLFSSSLLY